MISFAPMLLFQNTPALAVRFVGHEPNVKSQHEGLVPLSQSASPNTQARSLRIDVFCHSMGFLQADEVVACEKVCRAWKKMIFSTNDLVWKTQYFRLSNTESVCKTYKEEFIATLGFGKKMWNIHFGDIGEAPPLPNGIYKILKDACPFIQNKTVEQTHMLVLIPATLNGQSMTLRKLGESILKHRTTNYYESNFANHVDTPFETSHWVLMARQILDNSKNLTYSDQHALVASYPNYEVPRLAQAIACVFMEFVMTQKYLLSSENLGNSTRCQESDIQMGQMTVGGFSKEGLRVTPMYNAVRHSSFGIAPVRKF